MLPETMESTEKMDTSLGYAKPPWIFRGSARYQLHLVKSETARAFIPKELKLVEAFGYTLGGFFLANYEDSPVGRFDELVVIAGIVWNPPTSCAWAARVLVSNRKACMHGRKDVGLPSQVASFTKSVTALPSAKPSRSHGFLSRIGMAKSHDNTKNRTDVQVKEITNQTAMDLCTINFISAESGNDATKWLGPAIKLFLPSFSGRTEHNPRLLKYSCQIECRLRAAPPAHVLAPSTSDKRSETDFTGAMDPEEAKRNLSICLMLSKPILTLEFNCLKMQVEAPIVVSE